MALSQLQTTLQSHLAKSCTGLAHSNITTAAKHTFYPSCLTPPSDPATPTAIPTRPGSNSAFYLYSLPPSPSPSLPKKHQQQPQRPSSSLSSSCSQSSASYTYSKPTPVSPTTFLCPTTDDSSATSSTPRIQPQVASSHTLIPINLEPPSPLLLATTTFTPTSTNIVPLSISDLSLEEDDYIVDKFCPRPLLVSSDPDYPLSPTLPVHDTVEELLASCYPCLVPGSQEYDGHLNRLQRNRVKLSELRHSLDSYDLARRKRMSERTLSKSFEHEERRRFRARR